MCGTFWVLARDRVTFKCPIKFAISEVPYIQTVRSTGVPRQESDGSRRFGTMSAARTKVRSGSIRRGLAVNSLWCQHSPSPFSIPLGAVQPTPTRRREAWGLMSETQWPAGAPQGRSLLRAERRGPVRRSGTPEPAGRHRRAPPPYQSKTTLPHHHSPWLHSTRDFSGPSGGFTHVIVLVLRVLSRRINRVQTV